MKSILILFDNIVNLYIWILIIHVIFSWLVAFNVLNTSNRFVYSVLDVSYKLTASTFYFFYQSWLHKLAATVKFGKSTVILVFHKILSVCLTALWIETWQKIIWVVIFGFGENKRKYKYNLVKFLLYTCFTRNYVVVVVVVGFFLFQKDFLVLVNFQSLLKIIEDTKPKIKFLRYYKISL